MKSVLISIRPQWCEKIASGEKTIEVRKTAPKEVPFKAYIYCTKAKSQRRYSYYEGAYENSKGEIVYAQQHVIGEFICDKVYSIKNQGNSFVVANEEQGVTNEIARKSCLDYYDMVDYLDNKDGYGLHITALKIYNKPKELSEFISPSKAKKCVDYCINRICSNLGYEELCGAIRRCEYKKLTRPPQSYMFVEEVEQ